MAAFNARNADELTQLCTRDVEIVPLRAALEDIVYRGREGIEQWLGDLDESWSDLHIELDEVEERSPELQLVFGRIIGRGRGSAAPIEMTAAWVVRGRDGLATQIVTYLDRDAALAAAAKQSRSTAP